MTATTASMVGMSRWPGIVLALGFFAVRLATLSDFGETWDESSSYLTGARYLDITLNFFRDGTLPSAWPFHHIPGLAFIVDSVVVASGRLVSRIGGMSEVSGIHVVRLAMAALSIYLLFRLVQFVSRNTTLSALAASLLAVNLEFLAHAQNNPKDLPCVLLFVWAMKMAAGELVKPRGERHLVRCSALFALGVTTRPIFVILLPTLAAWWYFGFERASRPRIALAEWATLAAGSVVFSLLFWPWALQHPTEVVSAVRTGLDSQGLLRAPSMFLGTVRASDEQPLYYAWVLFLAATPIAMLLASAVGLSVLRPGPERANHPARPLIVLALCWLLPALLMEALGGIHYDVTRHLLFALPAFSVLCAVGAYRVSEIIPGAQRRWSKASARWIRVGVLVALPVHGVVLAWRLHPYPGAYLNEIARLYVGERDAADVFEVDYWGTSLLEGSNWLNANAEPDAIVHVPIAWHCAMPILKRTLAPEASGFADPSRPRYLMVLNRRGFKDAQVLQLEASYEPVFTITRQGGTLLRIFRNGE